MLTGIPSTVYKNSQIVVVTMSAAATQENQAITTVDQVQKAFIIPCSAMHRISSPSGNPLRVRAFFSNSGTPVTSGSATHLTCIMPDATGTDQDLFDFFIVEWN